MKLLLSQLSAFVFNGFAIVIVNILIKNSGRHVLVAAICIQPSRGKLFNKVKQRVELVELEIGWNLQPI